MQFPTERQDNADLFATPPPGHVAEINPPGFAWLPVEAAAGYRLSIFPRGSTTPVLAETLTDNLFVPSDVLEPGDYEWTVAALDDNGEVLATRERYALTVPVGLYEQPYPDISGILDEVPAEHPRIIFTKAQLPEIRAGLENGRREAFGHLLAQAEQALDLGLPVAPDYDKYDEHILRRREYSRYYGYLRPYIDEGALPLALAYLMTEEERFAQAALRIFFTVGQWAGEGLYSVNSQYGDEPGLSVCRCMHRIYDWLYSAMDDEQRRQASAICQKIARDNWQRIFVRRPFHQTPGRSHDGRLIAYIGEQALCLVSEAPRPEVAQWLDYSLKAFMTIYPHWGGTDGGWAEGIGYGLAYNSIYLPWIEALRAVSDVDLWQRPFFGRVRNFFMYCTTPNSEACPFGDGAERGMINSGRGPMMAGLLQHHGARFQDGGATWWTDQIEIGDEASFAPVIPMIASIQTPSDAPKEGRVARLFRGIGWCAMHSNFADFDEDVFVLFKSSPYGSVSHQHADQNAFHIAVGGTTLAIPSGYYGPQYGQPHHAEWTRATRAQNAILVNGEGQVIRDFHANGSIVGFEHNEQLTYVCGDATPAYMGKLDKWLRSIFFVRPGLIVIIDDIAAPEPSSFRWLLHALDEMVVDEATQSLSVTRRDARLDVSLWSSLGHPLSFSQTDQFETPFNEGQPEGYRREVEPQWHFTAETPEPVATMRFVAVIAVGKLDSFPDVRADLSNGLLTAKLSCPEGKGTVVCGLQYEDSKQSVATWRGTDESEYSVG